MQRQSLSISHQQTDLSPVIRAKRPPEKTLQVIPSLCSWVLTELSQWFSTKLLGACKMEVILDFPTSKAVSIGGNFMLKCKMPMGMGCFGVRK